MPEMPVITQLPDLFRYRDGRRVTQAEDWRERRAEVLETVLATEYGHLPPAPERLTLSPLSAFNVTYAYPDVGTTYRVSAEPFDTHFSLSMIIPAGEGPFPVIITGDGCWRYVTDEIVIAALKRGYALAIFDRTEIVPDVHGAGLDRGLYAHCPQRDFGALAAWAWGYQRVIDLLAEFPRIDRTRVAVTGHSRGGKAALLAGATDERIALTVPNNSGCGGAGSFHVPDEGGERLENLLDAFSFWFAPALAAYRDRAGDLPFDQHFLKALVAPRALLSTEARADIWASPRATRLLHDATRPIYRLLNAEARLGIWYREGGHGQGYDDWMALLDGADWYLRGKTTGRDFDMPPS